MSEWKVGIALLVCLILLVFVGGSLWFPRRRCRKELGLYTLPFEVYAAEKRALACIQRARGNAPDSAEDLSTEYLLLRYIIEHPGASPFYGDTTRSRAREFLNRRHVV
jgi:hypothetical protein